MIVLEVIVITPQKSYSSPKEASIWSFYCIFTNITSYRREKLDQPLLVKVKRNIISTF